MTTAKSLYINVYSIFHSEKPEQYLHELASNVRELPHGSVERLKETMQFLYNDYLSQINPKNEERRQITEEQKIAIRKLEHLNISLHDKNKMIDEILRFYSDLVEADLKLRSPEEVLRVCDNVLGKTAENLDDAISLLLEASSLREKKKTPGSKTKTTQVTPPNTINQNNNNTNDITIESNVKQTTPPKNENQNKTKEKQPQPQPTKNTNNNNNNNGSKKKNKQKNKQNNNPPPNNKANTTNNNVTKKENTNNNTTNKEEKTTPVTNNTNIINNTPTNTSTTNNPPTTDTPTTNTPAPKINYNNLTKSELIKLKNEQDIKFESFLKQRKELALQMSKLEENITNLLNDRNDMLNYLLNSK